MKALSVLLAAALLSGCALSAGDYEYEPKAKDSTDFTFVGVPMVAAFQGSSVPITPTLSLTALHVAELMPWRIVAVHGQCDLALIRNDNRGKVLPKLEDVAKGQAVTTNGYSGRTMLPVRGYGVVTGTEKDDRSGHRACSMDTTGAGAVQGMSGGAVLSADGGLAGILIGIDYNPSRTFYVPARTIRPWLLEHIK